MEFIQLKQSLKTKISPIYLLQGNDAFSLQKGMELLKKSLISMPEVNYILIEGEELQAEKLQQFILSCTAEPFLEKRRLLVVKNFHPTTKEFNKYCKFYFENPLESTVLVIVNFEEKEQKDSNEKGQAKKENTKVKLEKQANVQYVACNKLQKTDILKLIARICTNHSVAIEAQAADCLVAYTLKDMLRIENELLKLIAYVNTGGCITLQNVQDMVMPEQDFKIYELSNALALQKQQEYFSIQNDMQQKGVESIAILNTLLRHYQTLLNIYVLNKSSVETAEQLHIQNFAVQKYKEQIAKIGADKLTMQYKLLVRAINDYKNGYISQELALTQVVAKIFYQ